MRLRWTPGHKEPKISHDPSVSTPGFFNKLDHRPRRGKWSFAAPEAVRDLQ